MQNVNASTNFASLLALASAAATRRSDYRRARTGGQDLDCVYASEYFDTDPDETPIGGMCAVETDRPEMPRSSRRLTLAAAAVLAAHAALCIDGIRGADLSPDEKDHYDYALKVLELQPDRTSRNFDSKMPASALNALPRAIAEVLDPAARTTYPDTVLRGRYATIAASVALGALVFLFALRLYGRRAGLVALLLYAFSPTALAHGRLVTTDTYTALGFTGACFAFWRYGREAGARWRCAAAVAAGLAQLAKYTCIFLYPMLLAIGALRAVPEVRAALAARSVAGLAGGARRALGTAALFAAFGVLCVNLGFGFRGTFTPLAGYRLESTELSRLQAAAGWLAAAPLPVPYPYLKGLDMVRYHERTGRQRGNLYLLGESQEGDERVGFKSYYLVAYLLKEPLAYQVLLVAAAAACIMRRRGRTFLRDEVFLVVPIAANVLLLSFALRAQLGVRYLLAVLPLVYVVTSSLVRVEARVTRGAAAALVGLLLYGAASSLSYHPHAISYMNEIAWDRSQLYRYLGDSDLDWNMSVSSLRRYVEAHARRGMPLHVDPEGPVAGRVIVRAKDLQTRAGQARYAWLAERFRPAAHIDYCYLVYDVRPEQLERVGEPGDPPVASPKTGSAPRPGPASGP